MAQGAQRRSVNRESQLLYVSDELNNVVDIYSVPGYSKAGQISNGIEDPEGIATDENGNLFMSRRAARTTSKSSIILVVRV